METPATQQRGRRRKQLQQEESASEQEQVQNESRKSSKEIQKNSSKSQEASESESLEEGEDNTATRRKLRKNYRMEIDRIEEQKQELISPKSEGLNQVVKRSNKLYRKVNQPREAALDSELLVKVTQLGAEATSRIHSGFKKRDPLEFISKLRNYLRRGETNIADHYNDTDNQSLGDLEWATLGNKFAPYIKQTPPVSFIYGTFDIVPKPRKERAPRKEREKVGEKVVAEEVIDSESGGGLDKETSKRVTELRNYLEKAKKINFFEFIIDPESFTHTIENIFHFSFLVKDGHASLTTDESGMAIAVQPDSAEYHSGKATRKQCIINFTYEDWKIFKEKLNITKAFLPKRQTTNRTISQSLPPTQEVPTSKPKKRLRKNQTQEEESENETSKSKKKPKRKNNSHESDE